MTVRFGLGVRIMGLFVLATTLYSAPMPWKGSWLWLGSVVIVLLLTVHAWTYKSKIGETGIEIRYFPLIRSHAAWSDLVKVVEELVPLCIGTNIRFRIWGLTPKTRIAFLNLVPRHLLVSEPSGPDDVALLGSRKYVRLVKIIAPLFIFSVAVLVPFLDNRGLNRYWRPFGQLIVFTVGGLWLALIFTSSMALIHWLAHKDFRDHSRSGTANRN